MHSKLLMSAVWVLVAAQASAGNLFPEGSMEISGEQGVAEGFSYPDPNWLKGFGALVSVENEDGNRFIRVNMPRPEQLIGCGFEIPVPAGAKSLRVRWQIRATVRELSTKDEAGGLGVCVIASWFSTPRSIGDRGYKFGGLTAVRDSTAGWVQKEVILEVPEGKKFLAIQFGTKNTSAIADFDDFVIEKIP